MFATLAGVALIFGASLAVGQAICSICWRGSWSWLAPAVGIAALTVVTGATWRLPGHAETSAVVVVLLTVAALALLVRRRRELGKEGRWLAAGLAVVTLLVACIPFAANGRFGLLGISFNNDTAVHLVWAEGIRDAAVRHLYVPGQGGYPLGPHALVAAVGEVAGIRLDYVFVALMIAALLATALAAQAALERLAPAPRVVVGTLVAFVYLAAGYYTQGSFKETLEALYVVTFAVALRSLANGPLPRGRRAVAAGVPLGIVGAATVYVYSYLGVSWLIATVLVWGVAEILAASLTARRLRLSVPPLLLWPVLAAAALTAVVAVLPDIDRVLDYLRGVTLDPAASGGLAKTDLGNLAQALSPYEGLGLWTNPDYRFQSPNTFHAGQLAAFALGVGVFAALRWVARRDLLVPSAVAASAAIYFHAKQGQSPYVAAKGLMIAGPIFMLMCGGALLERPDGRLRLALDGTALRIAVGVVFLAIAAYSSSLVLRGAQVVPAAQFDDVRALAAPTTGQPTAFLGVDDYSNWYFAATPIASAAHGGALPSPRVLPIKPQKQWTYGEPLDFDNLAPDGLDQFTYVVTPRGSYASQPPTNLHLIRRTAGYELWRRVGPTPPRSTIEPNGQVGAVLDCHRAAGRRLAAAGGTAHVTPTPVLLTTVPTLQPGSSARVELTLPPGRWRVSVKYTSPQALRFSSGGSRWTLPAYLGRPGPYFGSGKVLSSGGRVPLEMSMAGPSGVLDSHTHVAFINAIAATRDVQEKAMSLRRACGRYVDWYAPRTRSR